MTLDPATYGVVRGFYDAQGDTAIGDRLDARSAPAVTDIVG